MIIQIEKGSVSLISPNQNSFCMLASGCLRLIPRRSSACGCGSIHSIRCRATNFGMYFSVTYLISPLDLFSSIRHRVGPHCRYDRSDRARSDYRVPEIQGTMTVYDLPQPYSIAFSTHPVLPPFYVGCNYCCSSPRNFLNPHPLLFCSSLAIFLQFCLSNFHSVVIFTQFSPWELRIVCSVL